MIVGLTGGIGSGKSTVAKMFREFGVPVYDSDEEAKKLMVASKTVRSAVMDLFGDEAYTGKALNKSTISNIVFKDTDKLAQLNQIVHPAVKRHFEDWTKRQNFPYIIQETALIFENRMQDRYDAIILVTAPEEIRIKRVMERDRVSKAQVLVRMDNQLLDAEKIPASHYVIENMDIPKTRDLVKAIHGQLIKRSVAET